LYVGLYVDLPMGFLASGNPSVSVVLSWFCFELVTGMYRDGDVAVRERGRPGCWCLGRVGLEGRRGDCHSRMLDLVGHE
jgi:hypothetical protein